MKMVSGEQVNHLAMGHRIKHPKQPFEPNVFVADISVEKHFLPQSFLQHLPNAMFEVSSDLKVLGVFLIESTADNTELLLDYKELHLLDRRQ